MARLGAEFDAVLSSPKSRASQTAEIAAAQWSAEQRERVAVHAPLAGGFDASQAREALSEIGAEGRLLLVGHEPDLSLLVGELTGGAVDIKKGGLAVVRLDGLGGELALLLRPRDLALIAGATVGSGSPADGD